MMDVMERQRIDEDRAWQAVTERDRAFDGRFVTGVLSTGIYCRPSCPARHPKRENVRFFANGPDAKNAGLRACRRCHPDDVAPDEAAVATAVRLLDRQPMTLDELGEATGYSPTHLQKIFKRALGVSPAEYGRARRARRGEEALDLEGNVTNAIYEAGYEAPSRFYDDADRRLGMTPSAWRDGGKGATIRYAITESPMGPLMVAATDKGICRLTFDEDEAALRKRFPNAEIVPDDGSIGPWVEGALAAVRKPLAMPELPLDVRGTAFQEAVWRELRKIPAGETRSYSNIAKAVGKPGAVRAVGTANGANPVSVIVPCHRVVRSDGSLGGYAGGLDRKRQLLAAEGASWQEQSKLDL